MKQRFKQFSHLELAVQSINLFYTSESLPATSLSKHTVLSNSCSIPSKAVTLLDLKSDCKELETPKFQVSRVKADKQNRH